MKDFVKISAAKKFAVPADTFKVASLHIITAICGFIASRSTISQTLNPFGIACMAGVPVWLTPAATVGAFFGYFIPAIGAGGFRYITTLFAILAIKLLLSSNKKFAHEPLFLGGITLISSCVTAFISLSGVSANPLLLLAEALLSAVCAYFTAIAVNALDKPNAGLTGNELAAFLIVLNILFAGLYAITPFAISPGRTLCILLILVCAKFGGTLSGAIGGIAVSFSAMLTDSTPQSAVIFALSGLMAGIFSTYGKYSEISALLICSSIGAVLSPLSTETVYRLIEALLGCVIFLLMPRNALRFFGKYLCIKPHIISSDGIKRSVALRLSLASNALSDVSQTVEQVSKELSKINTPDFGTVLSQIELESCSGCKLRLHCWENKKNSTIEAILEMTKAVRSCEKSPVSFAPTEFRARCPRIEKLSASVYKSYSQFASKNAAENRIEDVRSVVSDQFDGISSMLEELGNDITHDECYDHSTALSAAQALKNLGINTEECCCTVDKYGRMSLRIKLIRQKELIINKRQVMKMISLACDRDFDIPNVSEVGNNIFITISERAAFRVQVGVHQISAARNGLCGDAYQYFFDGKGHFIMILSDGMGTGGRAAVDGAMASGLMARLLRSGFGYDCALRILNSSMLFKSTDESMATVDIASIDLFSGELLLHKAGAAPTLVKRSGRCGKAESTSLPVGILREIGFDSASIKLKENDIVVILSDGAVNEGTDWIKNELQGWEYGSAQDLSEHICECARRRRDDDHEDDITAMVAIIHKAV